MDRISSLAGENVALKPDLTERDAHIAVLLAKLSSATAAAMSSPDRSREVLTSNGPASKTEIQLLKNLLAAAEDISVVIGKRQDELTKHQ